MSNITSFEILDQEIQKKPGKPTVLEALWDGDFDGWYLSLYLYTQGSGTGADRFYLGGVSLGGDIRLFMGGGVDRSFSGQRTGSKTPGKVWAYFLFPF